MFLPHLYSNIFCKYITIIPKLRAFRKGGDQGDGSPGRFLGATTRTVRGGVVGCCDCSDWHGGSGNFHKAPLYALFISCKIMV